MDTKLAPELQIEWLGRGLEYGEMLHRQEALVAERVADPVHVPERLLLLEHAPVYTIGRTPDRSSLLDPAQLPHPLFTIGRGGQATYHGPGQLVGYPIFLLRQEERDLHLYLRNLEEALIRTVGRFGIPGERKEAWTGVWTAGGARKLASIGVAVKRWVTLHGFALNVSTELARFGAINPCGLEATIMGSMETALGRGVSFAEVKAVARDELGAVFARQLS